MSRTNISTLIERYKLVLGNISIANGMQKDLFRS